MAEFQRGSAWLDKLDNAALTHPSAQRTRVGGPGTRGRSWPRKLDSNGASSCRSRPL